MPSCPFRSPVTYTCHDYTFHPDMNLAGIYTWYSITMVPRTGMGPVNKTIASAYKNHFVYFDNV